MSTVCNTCLWRCKTARVTVAQRRGHLLRLRHGRWETGAVTLDVRVSEKSPPAETENAKIAEITAEVMDAEHSQLLATFTYGCWWPHPMTSGPMSAYLMGMHVARRPDHFPELTVSRIRDLPLARWEAAARAHVVEKYSLTPADVDLVMEALTPVSRVDRLYPGLRDSTGAGDKRKYKSLMHLAEIANEFTGRQLVGEPDPATSIARDRGVNPATVRSWLHRARKAGLLRPATPSARS